MLKKKLIVIFYKIIFRRINFNGKFVPLGIYILNNQLMQLRILIINGKILQLTIFRVEQRKWNYRAMKNKFRAVAVQN